MKFFHKHAQFFYAVLVVVTVWLITPVLAGGGDVDAARKAWPMIEGGALLVDVRSKEEFDEGHLDGAIIMGELSLDEATAGAQQATRNYAKRQETWLRTQLPSAERTSGMQIAQYSESLLDDIFSKIRRFVLTG